MRKIVGFFLLIGFLFSPSLVGASIGVGVGTGKIKVEDRLKPGTIYELPSLTVLNTGDVTSEYEVTISFHENQAELKPTLEWFSFSPEKFSLNPGEAKEVKIKMNLPIRMEPGDYFAYLEAHPLKKVQSEGGASVGVAAAAKLYFTVVPANVFAGVYYKGISFWRVYAPWPQRVAILVGVMAIIGFLRNFLKIEINVKGKGEIKEDKKVPAKKSGFNPRGDFGGVRRDLNKEKDE